MEEAEEFYVIDKISVCLYSEFSSVPVGIEVKLRTVAMITCWLVGRNPHT